MKDESIKYHVLGFVLAKSVTSMYLENAAMAWYDTKIQFLKIKNIWPNQEPASSW